jgi:hypothetical protein
MPPIHTGATVVVHIADAQRDDVVLARITSRRGDRETKVSGPLLMTAEELAESVSSVVTRFCREIVKGPAAPGPPR